jgi:hypothetical protein
MSGSPDAIRPVEAVHGCVADFCRLELAYIVSNGELQRLLIVRWFGNPPVIANHFDPCDRNP